ncbi:hypothetical protein QBC34DRAFT_478693 [Podospora aff. communis PSN243]|uniref:2EXR domain-containing protein n=1 Tax=Podospora aff. communis PSN243 TaxID=3040156 RepID=A0AAV9G459_9PEZI|nr:hypothetical protein QBC34DRAFT_478693 [Podospora aff. communis PSN243]
MDASTNIQKNSKVNRGPKFHLFPRLPTELRLMIWEASLPDFGPCLFPYRPGCWKIEPAHPASNIPSMHWTPEASMELIIALPVMLASKEARSAALNWLRRNNLQLFFYPLEQSDIRCLYHCVARPFDPEHDVMYVPDGQWLQFRKEAIRRFWYTGLPPVLTYPTRLAITEKTFHRGWAGVAQFLKLQELFILHLDETWAEGREWWKHKYYSGPLQECCKLNIDSSEERHWTRADGLVTKFHDIKWDDIAKGEEMARESFRRMTSHAFGELERDGGFSDRCDVYRAWVVKK